MAGGEWAHDQDEHDVAMLSCEKYGRVMDVDVGLPIGMKKALVGDMTEEVRSRLLLGVIIVCRW